MKFFKLYAFTFSLLLSLSAHGADYSPLSIPHHTIDFHTAKVAPALIAPTMSTGRYIASVEEVVLVPGPDEELSDDDVIYSPNELAGHSRAETEIIFFNSGRTPASIDSERTMDKWEW